MLLARKPSIKQMKKRTTLWFDGEDLRICLSQDEQEFASNCHCKTCLFANSWWYCVKDDYWYTSFFGYQQVREYYEFVGYA